MEDGSRQLVHLGRGQGVNRQLVHLGRSQGVNRKGVHLGRSQGVNRKRVHLGDAGNENESVEVADKNGIIDWMLALAERIRRVRVCCGDWSRVCGPTPTVKQGLTAVFLDPPYSQQHRDPNLYAVEEDVATAVREWCAANGDDKRMRIALCGYAGEGHESLESLGWEVVAWKAFGGYGSQGTDTEGRENSARERIWFSPHCLGSSDEQGSLFDGYE